MQPEEKAVVAWQPLTPSGVGAFAYASTKRLLAAQFVVTVLVAAVVLWFVHEVWFPTVLQAIRHLPNEGQIRRGTLEWRAETPQRLAENRFLSLAVDLRHEGETRSPAHVQVEFGQNDYKLISLFGFVQHSYGRGKIMAFNRPELEPWWGAWSPVILVMIAVLVIVGLLCSWALLATLYFLPVWVLAFFANRELTFGGSWRLSGAALMPGALLLSVSIFFYGLGTIDLVRLLVAFGLHFVVGWIYLMAAPFTLRLHAAAIPAGNPFVPPVTPTQPVSPSADPQ